MSTHVPKIYTISPGHSFVDVLAEGIIMRFGDDPLTLSATTILLPNRRAVRSLQEAFLKLFDKRSMLLPMMRAIGDVDDGEIEFLGAGFGIDASEIVPAISPVKRQILLTKLVENWYGPHSGGAERAQTLAPAQAWRLAGELAHLIDQVETEGLTFEGLEGLAPDSLALHWNDTLEFLKIVTQAWPDILAEEGVQNPAAYRNQQLARATGAYEAHPPRGPIIAAGSTGSIPATAAFLKVIARLPQGYVVLPGLDVDMPEEIWAILDDTHPQSGLKRFIETVGASRHEVRYWAGDSAGEKLLRVRHIENSLLPAIATDRWRALVGGYEPSSIYDGMAAIVAPTRREEAEAIAVLMREVLETPGKTASLVTPDRQLALYVRAALRRWAIAIDDSGGDKAVNSLPGRFLALLANAVSEHFSPLSLLSLLQHPLVSCGMSREKFLPFVRRLDEHLFRGVRPAGGLSGLIQRAVRLNKDDAKRFSSDDLSELKRVTAILAPLDDVLSQAGILPDVLKCHVAVAEALAATDDTSGAAILWKGDAGTALAAHLTDLIQNSNILMLSGTEGYGTFFPEIMASVTVRPNWNQHPRLAIWGPLEARLQQADVMILGGLNEGTWPAESDIDPWMSRSMRTAFGLPSLDRRVGQSAHDFMLAASAPTVVLTRSLKVGGTPSVPSRWWFRLEALAQAEVPRATKYQQWAQLLDQPSAVVPCLPPAPTPPLAARPNKLSVTQIQEWMRDPYALYAKKILGLKKLDPLDDRPNAATKGTLLHEALECFLKEDGPTTGATGHARLLDVGRRVFEPVLSQPTVYAFWWPRFERIAEWFAAFEEKRQATYRVALIEDWAEHTFQFGDQSFTLVAKADRIDAHLETGALSIIDYKTGGIPTVRQIEAGYAPQLPLEGLLAEKGAFNGLEAGAVNDLSFWKLGGGEPVFEEKRPIKDVQVSIDEAEVGLALLVKVFSDPKTAYLSNPRPSVAGYGDYDHLARVKEWQSGTDPLSDQTEVGTAT